MTRLFAAVCLSLLVVIWLVGTGESQVKTPKTVKGQVPAGWGKGLDLTEEQSIKIRSVDASFKTKIHALEEQIDGLKTQAKQEMVKLLTEDQKTKLRKLATGEEGPPDRKKTESTDNKKGKG
ncbi:MAG: hypothetical protein L0Y72_09050 [Gemmataceae bacterium]|nr:hypothetical protein [Gemmataceae bacterium]MCI0739178.1 hypothetical protein [Gemmataceae bacterium]